MSWAMLAMCFVLGVFGLRSPSIAEVWQSSSLGALSSPSETFYHTGTVQVPSRWSRASDSLSKCLHSLPSTEQRLRGGGGDLSNISRTPKFLVSQFPPRINPGFAHKYFASDAVAKDPRPSRLGCNHPSACCRRMTGLGLFSIHPGNKLAILQTKLANMQLEL